MRYLAAACALAALTTQAMAEDGYTAKSLFFGEDNSIVTVATSPAPVASDATVLAATQADAPESTKKAHVVKVASHRKIANVGASYFIRMKDADGTTHDVLARRVFKSGDHFQLGIKVNRPSYVYIFNQAPDGSIAQIYPQPAQDNFVDAMGVVFLPARGTFAFDDQPGMEKLMVYMTAEPVRGDLRKRIGGLTPDLVSTPAVAAQIAQTCAPGTAALTAAAASAPDAPLQVASADIAHADYAAKGIAFSPDASANCAGTSTAASDQDYTAKGIVFSDDAAPAAGGQVASYVVKPSSTGDAKLYLKINLAHE